MGFSKFAKAYHRADVGIGPYIKLRGKLEFDCCKSDTERVWEVTIPFAPGTHWHRALRGKSEFDFILLGENYANFI